MRRLTDGDRAILAELEADARDYPDDIDWDAPDAEPAPVDPERPAVPGGADEGGGTAEYPW